MSSEALAFQMKVVKLPEPVPEYKFHPSRRWRADYCWPDQMLIVEYEGGVYTKGRHTRGRGFEGDIEKYNTATLMGYRVLRFTASMVKSGKALKQIEQALNESTRPNCC